MSLRSASQFVGKWLLDLEKSKFGKVPLPLKDTYQISITSKEPVMIRFQVDTQVKKDVNIQNVYSTDLKGMKYPLDGEAAKGAAKFMSSELIETEKDLILASNAYTPEGEIVVKAQRILKSPELMQVEMQVAFPPDFKTWNHMTAIYRRME